MSFDSRLVIERFSSFKGVELCPFLKTMDEQEKATQTEELKLFNKAMVEYRSHDCKAIASTVAMPFSLSGLFVSLIAYAFMPGGTSDRRFMGKPLFILTALVSTIFVIGSLFGMIKYNVEASKVKFPNLNYVRLLRVQTRIREIEERLQTGGLPDSEKKQLNDARDALKLHRHSLMIRPFFPN